MREGLFQGHSQLVFGDRADFSEGARRNPILEAREHFRVFRGQHIRAGANELAALENQPAQLDGGIEDRFRRASVEALPSSLHLVGFDMSSEHLVGLDAHVDPTEGRRDSPHAICPLPESSNP